MFIVLFNQKYDKRFAVVANKCPEFWLRGEGGIACSSWLRLISSTQSKMDAKAFGVLVLQTKSDHAYDSSVS